MSVRVKICARKRIYAAMYVLVSVCTRLRRRAVSISHSEPRADGHAVFPQRAHMTDRSAFPSMQVCRRSAVKPGESSNAIACDKQSGNARHKGDRCRSAAANDRILIRPEHRYVGNTTVTQLYPHDLSERTNARLGNIADAKAGRIELVSGAHTRYHRNTELLGCGDDRQLTRSAVDSVDNKIGRITAHERGNILRRRKHFVFCNVKLGIYAARTLSGKGGFFLPTVAAVAII